MDEISIGGPFPTCEKCSKGPYLPVKIEPETGIVTWKCSNCGRTISKEES